MDDLLTEFLTETSENLSVLDVEIVRLEQNPNDIPLLSNIFRLVHTIKGTCGFLGLPRLERVAHASENVLGKFRDGVLPVTPEAVSLILESFDCIKNLLAVLEQTQAEPAGDDSDLIARLNAMADSDPAALQAAAPPPKPVEAPPPAPAAAATAKEEAAEDPEAVDAALAAAFGEPVRAEDTIRAAAPPPAPVAEAVPAKEAAPKEAAPKEAAPSAEAKSGEAGVAGHSIRVNVELLENLMTMVSELVLTRNQCLQILRSQKESPFAAPLQRLNHIVSELQEGVMKTRMQPIGNAWSKLPRIVRDLSRELNKKIDLVMVGAETELDRQVLELIKDPLTHMVRNSADHGVETPADRVRAGKDETGKITLNAFHEGGHIVIEIADDGKGLAIDKIRAKALANGLATESDLASMSDQQILQFIFKAGFSTAEKVTAVSGRGVGMDVVRTNIEKIGGTVDLQSEVGKGSKFTIKIPLTLAIVSALIVESGRERFAIPQISVVELVRASATGENRIERLKGAPVLRLRNRLLPLVSLRSLLKLDSAPQAEEDAYIVVTQVGNYTFGMMVDRVFDTEEIVVKPVAPILRDIALFSGNTILGDGTVIMILDPNGIAQASGQANGSSDSAEAEAAQIAAETAKEKTTLLVVRAGDGAPMAVPLALVSRLEDFDRTSFEQSGAQTVVQYRGQLMPLVACNQNWTPREGAGRQPVVVFTDNDRAMGLLVDEIVDIVEDAVRIEMSTDVPGVLGSAVIAGKATDIVDVGFFLQHAFDDWFRTGTTEAFQHGKERKRLLLVDDSPFFRNMVTPLLQVAGYEVIPAENGEHARALCETGQKFDVIISDIEMPVMNGFEFAQWLRSNGRWQDTPIVALSSHAQPEDFERGREVGFTDYVAKFDREQLLKSVAESLSLKRGAA
jgi:two-component system chemotaxis sensor kinase CheA